MRRWQWFGTGLACVALIGTACQTAVDPCEAMIRYTVLNDSRVIDFREEGNVTITYEDTRGDITVNPRPFEAITFSFPDEVTVSINGKAGSQVSIGPSSLGTDIDTVTCRPGSVDLSKRQIYLQALASVKTASYHQGM